MVSKIKKRTFEAKHIELYRFRELVHRTDDTSETRNKNEKFLRQVNESSTAKDWRRDIIL